MNLSVFGQGCPRHRDTWAHHHSCHRTSCISTLLHFRGLVAPGYSHDASPHLATPGSLAGRDIPRFTADNTDRPLILRRSHGPSSSLAVIDVPVLTRHVTLYNYGCCFCFFKSYTEYFCRDPTVFSLVLGLSVLWAVSRVRGSSYLNLSSTPFETEPSFL